MQLAVSAADLLLLHHSLLTLCDQSGIGNFYDITKRVDATHDRRRLSGRSRTLPTWIVPQAFDDDGQEFWFNVSRSLICLFPHQALTDPSCRTQVPTGDEGALQIILGYNHGVIGHCAWNSQYSTPDLLSVSAPHPPLLLSELRR